MPDQGKHVKDASVENLLERAQVLMEVGRNVEAISVLKKAAMAAPEDHRVLCRLSLASIRLKDYTGGLNYAKLAVAAAPDSEWAHRLSSIAYRCLKDPQKATAAARRAVTLDVENCQGYQVLAMAQIALGDVDGAGRSAERALELAPSDADILALQAEVAISLGKCPEAEKWARQALEIDAENAEALRVLGNALLRTKGKRAALPCYVTLLKLDPGYSTVQQFIIECFSGFTYLVAPLLLISIWAGLYLLFPAASWPIWVAAVTSLAACPLLFRFWPESMLYPQLAFWKLPAPHRRFVAQTWRREWVKRGLAALKVSGISVLFVLITLAAPGARPFLIAVLVIRSAIRERKKNERLQKGFQKS
jgi:tetratricopeptide (TPR) repeat protein